ncbi:MAG: sugar phosphate isomerase/epimerase [Verrucomicrobia bacterium]|nr:sugar phosphate isomerase/epimerase [Verrucomicrobiota bacterium]
MKFASQFSRRIFLRALPLSGVAIANGHLYRLFAQATTPTPVPIALWSEVCQELNLSFAETAAVTAEAGLDGIDCPVRPGGQVLPERAADDLPRLAEALAKHRLKILLMATGIANPTTPHAETVLRAASKLGVKYYRLAYWRYEPATPHETTIQNLIAQLKDLAALNRELGLCALMHHHPGDSLVGAKLLDFLEIARAFSPDEIAVAFDIGHALNELKGEWRDRFLAVRRHIRVMYLRDFKANQGYVAMGKGDVGASGFFPLLREMNYRAPISYHLEYPWHQGRQKDRKTLVEVMKREAAVMRGWLRA